MYATIRYSFSFDINPFCLKSQNGTVTNGFDARLANQPFLVLTFGHSGAQLPELVYFGKTELRLSHTVINPFIIIIHFKICSLYMMLTATDKKTQK